jgi:hypothetical protein
MEFTFIECVALVESLKAMINDYKNRGFSDDYIKPYETALEKIDEQYAKLLR